MTPSSELKLISWTAAVVVILGVASVFSLLQPPQGFERIATQASAGRSIASVSGAHAEVRPSFNNIASELQTMDVKTTCKTNQPIKIAGTVREVRLSGLNCTGSAKLITTEIKNITNGFVATVFRPSPKSFTTDYVTLVGGTNRILIRDEFANGKINEREYEITRN